MVFNSTLFNSILILYGDMINDHHDLFVVVWLRFVVKVLFDIGGIVDRVQCSNIMVNITLHQIRTENNYNLKYFFEDSNEYHDFRFQYNNDCSYLEHDQFPNHVENLSVQSYFRFNCRGLSLNWESFRDLLCDLHTDHFSFVMIDISEVFSSGNDNRIYLPGYQNILTRSRDDG